MADDSSHESCFRSRYSEGEDMFRTVGRPAYMHVNLDAISNNVTRLRQRAKNPNIAVVAMVKANAYGHGAVPVALHLKSKGVERLGVATTEEGAQLRNAGVSGPIHVFGNVQGWEVEECLRYDLTATMATADAIRAMGEAIKWHSTGEVSDGYIQTRNAEKSTGLVHIKIDTGMSRNGCQPDELQALIQLCEDFGVPLEGIFTHLANYADDEFTKQQMDVYYTCIKPYRNRGLLFHAANSGAILTGVGTELDMMRPGIALYGLSPGGDVAHFASLGFVPAASVHGQASVVKQLTAGRQVGYGCTYTCGAPEWVATIPVGYGDFYWRHLSNKGVVIRQRTGERCPVIGRVSMDAITVKVQPEPEPVVGESFTLLSADFDEKTSASGMADVLDTITYEVTTRFQERLPRYFTTGSKGFLLSMTHRLEPSQ